ncbi:hypothetical protein EGH24_06315 [Halonotius terrestris]|uniref:Peptidase S8/S53 domain-containing protein n=1 Tax=Halonotius terrestris TaxID=2487750 RepID=A0A8J8TCB7_9EURY|nr:hypothetical protein EGH24_06315 [Halonotius terrestris]
MAAPEKATGRAILVVCLLAVTGGLIVGGLSDPAEAGESTTDTKPEATGQATATIDSSPSTVTTTATAGTRSLPKATNKSTVNPAVVTPATLGPPPVNNTTHALSSLGVNAVWSEFQTRGEGVTIAVLDSGVAAETHPSLAPTDDGWADFATNQSDPTDTRNHGTLTSGVLVGNTTPDGTRYGIAPEADLIHANVFHEDGDIRTSDVIRGIDWAIDHPRDPEVLVINVNHKGVHYDRYVDAIERARAAGVYVVVPAGNDGDELGSPGSVYSALSVGATTATGDVAPYSSGGIVSTRATWGVDPIYEYDWPESYVYPTVVAPGSTITASADGGYRRAQGTSFAAPHAAGTVALMQAASDRHLTPAEIDRALLATARQPIDSLPNTRYGYGVVDAYAAVGAVADKPPYFAVTRLEHTAPIERGERVAFEAEIQNVGNVTDTQLVTMHIDGERFGSRLLTLNGTETATVGRTRGVACVEHRQSSITIETDNTSLTAPIEICAH